MFEQIYYPYNTRREKKLSGKSHDISQCDYSVLCKQRLSEP